MSKSTNVSVSMSPSCAGAWRRLERSFEGDGAMLPVMVRGLADAWNESGTAIGEASDALNLESRSVAPFTRWIGYNVLDWFMRDMTTKELIIMADPNRPRHYEEEFKRQIVQLYENGKPSSQIRAEYGIPRSTLQRWVQGIRNSGSTKAADNRTPEENELIELRKRNRQLEMEVGVSEQAAPVSARR